MRDQLGAQAREAVQTLPDDGFARTGLTDWDVDDLPETVDLDLALIHIGRFRRSTRGISRW